MCTCDALHNKIRNVVSEQVCVWMEEEEEREEGADTELKTKTPHVNVGNKKLVSAGKTYM